jgi:hypothetical protein
MMDTAFICGKSTAMVVTSNKGNDIRVTLQQGQNVFTIPKQIVAM